MQEEKRRGRVKAGVAEMGMILERKETSGKELHFFEAKFASHKTRTGLWIKISSGDFSEDGGNYTLIRTSTWTWKRWDGHLHGCACVSLPFICAHVVGTLCQLWDAQPSSSSWEDFIQLRGSLDHSAHKEMKLVAKSSFPRQALNFSVSFLL